MRRVSFVVLMGMVAGCASMSDFYSGSSQSETGTTARTIIDYDDPDFHGQGIGAPLTISGLHYLANKGISLGMLYVESDNLPAIRIYEKIGFSVHSVNRAFHN